ncbi:uncharacterized protein G2W53_006307 [Senna tora]|uniref:Uncharacterized protein n=1 Tax=Senna tora TaxID=362788 RepID=A0A835CEN7_9FABA|nr:uncharacterized protein G2W53_006307 [Senna tora]
MAFSCRNSSLAGYRSSSISSRIHQE